MNKQASARRKYPQYISLRVLMSAKYQQINNKKMAQFNKWAQSNQRPDQEVDRGMHMNVQ